MGAVLAIGAFGTLIGSFLNVVIARVPAGRSVVRPPSACGACGHAIRPIDNVPVISWLLLRGRCRDCRAAISVRYPLIELGAAVFFGVVAWRFLAGFEVATGVLPLLAGALELVAYLSFAAVSLALAAIDLDVRRLPNAIVLPSFLVQVALLVAVAVLGGRWAGLVGALGGAVALGGLYLLLALVKPGAMGFGDVKLSALVGLMLGWLGLPEFLVGAFAGVALGGLFGIALLFAGRGRRAVIAYGPWLLGGAWLGILLGEPIAEGYLRLFGIT